MEMEWSLLYAVVLDWVELALRWLHIITAIAWIGSSFYFIALDLGLRRYDKLPEGVHGEAWQVHGGGFYRIQKYRVAPPDLPEQLTWFKWESYATWLSGFALMVVVYYLGADLYLLDATKADLPLWAGIGLSLGVLGLGWVGYDRLCKSKFGEQPIQLMLALYAILVMLAYGLGQIFTGRGAFLHLGAITATIMSFNVLLVIIPNQRIVVADLKAGRTPQQRYGAIAKQRSTHNNYLTLPVIFFMLSSHYPLAYATPYSWIIAALVILLGVSIRHYFNSRHAGLHRPRWTWVVTVLLFASIVILSLVPLFSHKVAERAEQTHPPLSGFALQLAHSADFQRVRVVLLGRCLMCHATQPFYPGIHHPPKGVVLETKRQIVMQAQRIVTQSALSHAMPPANVSYMQEEERQLLLKWYRSAGSAQKS